MRLLHQALGEGWQVLVLSDRGLESKELLEAITTLGWHPLLRVKKGGTEQEMAVAGGFLQVNADRVLILADQAVRADEIDAAAAEEARRQAEKALTDASRSGDAVQIQAARADLATSMVQLRVVRRRRGGQGGVPTDR